MIRLRAGSSSLVGQVRTANEDSFLVTDDMVAVADGMGGHRAGEVASALTVEVLSGTSGRRSLADLVLAVHLANRAINERAAEDESLRGMGTTVCVVGVVDEDGEHLAVLNVGDSRVYLFASGELTRLTEDHSLVETLVREGRITPDEAEVHPQRNVLTRALGVEALVVVDAWLLAPCAGDRLLLCSDGLFNELSEAEIAAILDEGDEAEVAARRLAAEADAAGGRDNITAVVVDLIDADRPAEALTGRFRRIATPTVDLDDAYHDPVNDTATVPLVPISAPPQRGPEVGSNEESTDGDPVEDDLEESADAGPDDGVEEPSGPGPVDMGELDEALDRAAAEDARNDHGDEDGDSAEADHEGPPGLHGSDDAEAPSSRQGISWRTPVFIVAILLLIAGAFGIVALMAGRGWFVGPDGATVAIYRGTPGGFLWIQPELEQESDIELSDLTDRDRADVEERRRAYDKLADAERYLANLEDRTTTTTTTTTAATTTTTAPPVETVPPAPDQPAPDQPAPAAPGDPAAPVPS